MTRWPYRRWDGSQDELRLDVDRALDALSDLLMEGFDLEQAMAALREQGFPLAGQDFRVMGTDEIQEEIRRELAALAERFHLDDATRALEHRLEDLLRREDDALRREHGAESLRWNEFRTKRDAPADDLSERIERFRDHALFIAFAPVGAPRYAAACVVEHGGGGSRAAAPVVRDVMTEMLLRDPAAKPAFVVSDQVNGAPTLASAEQVP